MTTEPSIVRPRRAGHDPLRRPRRDGDRAQLPLRACCSNVRSTPYWAARGHSLRRRAADLPGHLPRRTRVHDLLPRADPGHRRDRRPLLARSRSATTSGEYGFRRSARPDGARLVHAEGPPRDRRASIPQRRCARQPWTAAPPATVAESLIKPGASVAPEEARAAGRRHSSSSTPP